MSHPSLSFSECNSRSLRLFNPLDSLKYCERLDSGEPVGGCSVFEFIFDDENALKYPLVRYDSLANKSLAQTPDSFCFNEA